MVHSPGLRAMIHAQRQSAGLGHLHRAGEQRHAGESAEQSARHAFNGELRNLMETGSVRRG